MIVWVAKVMTSSQNVLTWLKRQDDVHDGPGGKHDDVITKRIA